ncbi:MAG: S9 family peptidase [Taibaiella sp.]|nr:S9 family peptidase [Taibaiella sp.]
MRYTLYITVTLFFAMPAMAQKGSRQLTLEDVFKNNIFQVKDVPGFKGMKDGRHYTQLDKDGGHQLIRAYNLDDGKQTSSMLDNTTLKAGGGNLKIDRYELSKDEKKILLFTESENIYRHSVLSKVYLYDTKTGNEQLIDNENIMHATVSPDGSMVAFVKHNNLYYKDIAANTTVQVTFDGAMNSIINGSCDWVYEEEFAFTKAFEWSGNGRYLAYYRFDESKVPEYTMAKYTGLYPEQYTYKYPKAGERNSEVQIKIYDIKTSLAVNADLGVEKDQYIPRIKWLETEQKLCIYRLNRLQNKLELMLARPATGTTEVIYTEKNKYYIDINDQISFLPDGHSMILRSERSGYNHLYHYNWNSRKLTALTSGEFDIDALIGVDKVNKLVYYTAAQNSPMQRNLYVTGWNGYGHKSLTPEKGMHNITPIVGYNYFLDKFSSINKVPVYYLRNAEGRIIRTLEDNSILQSTIDDYALGAIKFMKVKGVSESLNAWMITPPGFDATKKYPVLMFQYSGPGSQQVLDQFPAGNYWWHQLLAQKGYIVVCADGTGTGFRGEAFKKKTYLQLGKYESEDQIAVAKYLGGLPYVNKDRIGIWGWSYGGFMSSTCLMKGNDVFNAAIAVAPVTNWRYYDNIYTERYMRTPQENPNGYDDNSPVKMVDKLKGTFLLIHGTADDNVHFQNATMLTTAMVAANKEFDSEFYTDKAHGISGGNTRYHLFRKMTQFLLENL